ncbi:murein biosynthesis integral membrane protein MurJ [Candidatus Gottesmanbacteria bacterium RBG_16_37_8]|uniref:Probable lipid II flippase MurJ n=1 Tax=Candidatus Gottesmanbacteria bacterium RBG_16_37_8 TaxID=1798371 RepID=A0A1F5YQV1_9BACT|nr:MAG: murein biosynthesis integral membrane protein MurJ [Candidatus Gottesmanbacteria bacterium RBG_16_37_8]
MVKLIRKTINLLNRREDNILSAASVIMTAVAFSRVLGLLRDRLLAARFPPEDLGVYYAAFRLPNMIFELLVMGALASAFIPVFTSYLDTKGKDKAFQMASSIINIGTVIFFLFAIPMLIFTKEISLFLAPGFNSEQISLMASFTRVMIAAQVFPLIIGNFLTGILQSFRNFLVPSLAPVIYNLGIILGIIIFSPLVGLYAPVIGVVIGAVLFSLIQIPPVLSYGYRHSASFSLNNPGVRSVGKLMLPRTLGLAVSQIDTTIDLVLSTLLGAGSVTVFNFAQHLQQLPIGLFGASIAQATLPSLSSSYANKDHQMYKKIFLSSFHQILFLVAPLSAMLIVLRIPIVRLVFGASTLFDWESTVLTGKTLAFFSLSLFAQASVHLLARSFYALHDSKTPLYIGGISVITNTLLSIIFIMVLHLPVWSLGLSASVGSIVNMLFLTVLLYFKVKTLTVIELVLPAIKIFLAASVSAVAVYIPIKLLDALVFDTTRTFNLFILTGISMGLGVFVYLFFAWFLDIPQIAVVRKLLITLSRQKANVAIDTSQEVVNDPESTP